VTGRTLVIADAVFGVSAPPLAEGPGSVAVLVEGGRVADIGRRRDLAGSDAAVVDLTGRVLVPGLVNAHTHLQYSSFSQAIGARDFFTWIRTLTSLIPTLDAGGWLASARLGALENLTAGVTSVGDIFSRGESLAALAEAGLGGVAFRELIGPDPAAAADAAAILERELAALSAAADGAGVSLGLSPHAPYTCDPSLYVAARRIADRERLRLATHVAETRDEVDLLRDGTGAFAGYVAARRAGFDPPRATPVRYLDRLGFWSGGPVLAVHAVHLTAADRRILAERGATIVTCPSSNERLGTGRADVPAARGAGVRVAVGSDSLASTESIDLLAELAILARRHRSLAPETLLEMATRDAAEALGLEPGAGTLTVGGPADLAAFALPGPAARSTARSTAVFSPPDLLLALFAAAPRADAVMRGGKWLVRHGKPLTMDETSVRAAAREVATALRHAAAALTAGADGE
jgi:cytosine/adenosine deaminase-related metal-dependent hydrolase